MKFDLGTFSWEAKCLCLIHLLEGKTKAEKGYITYPKSQSYLAAQLGFRPEQLGCVLGLTLQTGASDLLSTHCIISSGCSRVYLIYEVSNIPDNNAAK